MSKLIYIPGRARQIQSHFSWICIFTILAFQAPLAAQKTTGPLSLSDVVNIATSNSREALQARERFRSSYWQYRSFKAEFLPSLKLNSTFPSISRSIITYTTSEGQNIFLEQSVASYSLQMQLNKTIGFSGGSVYMRSGLTRIDNFSDTTLTSYLSTPVIFGINQPVLAYNPYRWARKTEPLLYEEARRKYIEDNEQVSINAINYFFNLLQAEISMKIAEVNAANYDTLYKIARGRYNLGKIAENELLQLELSYLRASAEVDNASLSLQMNRFKLTSFLGLPESDNENIRLLAPGGSMKIDVPLDRARAEARANRSDMYDFQSRLFDARSKVQQARLENRFNANLYGEYGLSQSAADWEDAYKNPQDEQILSFGIQVPILDWGRAKGRIRMAQANYELVKTSVEQEQIDFEQEIYIKVMQFNMQAKQVAIAAKADTVAQKRYYVTKQRYLIGKIDITDLNIAQTETDNARLAYFSALRELWRSYYELRRLTHYDFLNDRKIGFDFDAVKW